MSSEQLNQFAEELKKAREDANLTLQMLYQRTRIDIKYLEAIENGEFDVIDEVFLRAFIKGFAKNVGLDEKQIIKKYDLAQSGRLPDLDEENEQEVEKKKKLEDSKKKIVYTSEHVSGPHYNPQVKSKLDPRIFIFVGFIIALFAVLYFVFIHNNSSQIIKEPSLGDYNQVENKVDRFELISPDSSRADSISSGTDSLLLKITGLSRTWIRVTTDKDQQSEFTLQINESRVITADSLFNLLIGNAGGIKLELNNKPLDLVGKSGEIKSIHINSSGIKYLRINPEKK